MVRRLVLTTLAAFAVLTPAACGPSPDLGKALTVTDVITGYYDAGIGENGWNHLTPSITFKLHNVSESAINEVDLSVDFWQDKADGEFDSLEVPGIGAHSVAPGASSDPITVRSNHGYNLEAPRAQLFEQSLFVDMTAKLFAKRGGMIYKLGEFKLDRQIIPHIE
jgi:hypothetical protein